MNDCFNLKDSKNAVGWEPAQVKKLIARGMPHFRYSSHTIVIQKKDFNDALLKIEKLLAPTHGEIQHKESPSGYVYLIDSNRRTKIGHTKNIRARFSAIRATNPDVTLFGWVKVSDRLKVEDYWHSVYLEKRICGEWFKLTKKEKQSVINHTIQYIQFFERYENKRNNHRHQSDESRQGKKSTAAPCGSGSGTFD